MRAPGLRDRWLAAEVLARLEGTGRTRLFARFTEGLEQHNAARRESKQARVDSAAADVARVSAIRAMVLSNQPVVTRRPELYKRLADALTQAHDVARMVDEYGASAPASLRDDGTLLRRAQTLVAQATRVREERESWDAAALLQALADELDTAVELAASTPRSQGRILVLERSYEAAQQLGDLLLAISDPDLITSFTHVFVRLASLNQELGASNNKGEQI